METITVIEAVRRAIDPWGMGGQHTSAMQPSAVDVIDRLRTLGFIVIRSPIEQPRLEGIEQYQVESR
jgi:hypothetical protein